MTADVSVEEEWKELKQVLQAAAKEVCGTTKGGKKRKKPGGGAMKRRQRSRKRKRPSKR